MVARAAVSAVAESSRPEEPEPAAVAACLGSRNPMDRAPTRAAVGL